ncbi:MAG TPA: hypothetical protein VJ063_08580 [Verrucomicrobiae bacterium]|nr:hypothetical protein [Verrucomicrobiae bacterium]
MTTGFDAPGYNISVFLVPFRVFRGRKDCFGGTPKPTPETGVLPDPGNWRVEKYLG